MLTVTSMRNALIAVARHAQRLASTLAAYVRWITSKTADCLSRLNALIFRAATSVRFWFFVNLVLLFAFVYPHFFQSKSPWSPDFFSVASNLLLGGVVSFGFYYLVVYIPEKRRKHALKQTLLSAYKRVKEDILWEVLGASIKGGRRDLILDSETVARLMDIKEFRAEFTGGREANEGYYAFQNVMTYDNAHFHEIIISFSVLLKHIEFLSHNFPIDDQKTLNRFKLLEERLEKIKHSEAGYDESKSFCQFIFEIFAGFSFVDGCRDYDLIQKWIEDL